MYDIIQLPYQKIICERFIFDLIIHNLNVQLSIAVKLLHHQSLKWCSRLTWRPLFYPTAFTDVSDRKKIVIFLKSLFISSSWNLIL